MTVFDGWVANAVRSFKYNRERDRAQFLAEAMSPAFASLTRPDVIIPVPLHPKRQEWRGFNQAHVLAKHVGKSFGVSVEPALQRIRNTSAQTRSSREERLVNMEGAFALSSDWTPQANTHYVLMDDVYTTGATIGACAEALEAAGAKLISVVTIALDLQKRELDAYKDLVIAASPQ